MSTQVEIDVFNLKGTIDGLKWLYDNIDNQMDEMLEEIVKKGETYLDSQYISRNKDANITDISTDYKKTMNGYDLRAYGKDVVYEEFGTGDEGASHPHPNKSDYNLNDYNSGPYIRDISDIPEGSYTMDDLKQIGITSGKFWLYKKDGILHYTQGVPSGQEMWKTRNYILKEIPNIVKKRGKILNENIVKSIKN